MRLTEFLSGAVQVALFALPWPLRRRLLGLVFGFRIAPTARLGLSLVFAKEVVLSQHASISHFTIVSPIQRLELGACARIGPRNRITGRQVTADYAGETSRIAALVMEEHSAITRDHLIDCTNTLTIGRFALIAGAHTQVLTHSPDFERACQSSAPSRIGAYCFIGTSSVILAGVNLADYCLLGAGSVLSRDWRESHWFLAGLPARPVKRLPSDLAFFTRTTGRLG